MYKNAIRQPSIFSDIDLLKQEVFLYYENIENFITQNFHPGPKNNLQKKKK